jgi:hypothetical protein
MTISAMKTNRTIRNCKDDFKFICPKSWDKLERTEKESVRFCTECKENVFLCRTDEETIKRAQSSQCIAREIPDASEVRPVVVGRPKEPIVRTPEEKETDDWFDRERGIDKSLVDLKYSHRKCPKCGYPAPDWRVQCPVCKERIGRV